MIAPMKKAAVIVQEKDAEEALKRLRSLGVLHVQHERPLQGADLNRLREDLACVDAAVEILSRKEFIPAPAAGRGLADTRAAARHKDRRDFVVASLLLARRVVDLDKRKERLEEYSRRLKTQMAQWGPWGDFSPRDIASLARKGVYARLYSIPMKEIKNLPPHVSLAQVSAQGGVAHCVVISRERAALPFKEVPLPKMGLSEMRARLDEDGRVLASITEEMRGHAAGLDGFQKARNILHGELDFLEALAGMGTAGPLLYVTGFLPAEQTAALSETARYEQWGLVLTEPSDEDRVPTLIRNPKWVSLIAPVFKMLEIVPGYRELDTSFWFLVFFSIFFGILIGDAGYGLIYFFLTLWLHKKFSKKLGGASLFFLFYILSSCAVVWGVLTATYFGQEWLPAWVKPFVPALRDEKATQSFCFFLGALHLSIAHLWRALLKLPSSSALADMGWASVLWGSFFLARLLVLGEGFPHFAKWFFVAGPALVVFFTSPGRHILKSIGSGFGALLLSFVNTFTDIVSYIRLFAVGLATVAVADAFNKMALEVGFGGAAAGFAASLILVFGHALNVVLGPMAVLVHGVRLNVLEFSSHADIKWSGFAYRPLRSEG